MTKKNQEEENLDENPATPDKVPSENSTPAPRDVEAVKYDVIAAMKTVYDPEIPVDIYELGLIYELEIDEKGVADIVMTLTTPMCPAAEILPPEVEAKARDVEGISDVRLELVWEPPWDMEMMSPAARLALNV
ncbi:MAG: iron-sulfur cluster assembly protein [Myxococcota bacterium]|nr:iron-sulfur cluster assembly protein [Myxococcota bacterium]